MSDTSYSSTNPLTTTVTEDITVAAEVGPMVPVGMVLPFAGSGDPIGYLCCDGRAISRTTYAGLFAVIGTTYGSGNGSTTFNIPNLNAKFIEGSTTSGTVKQAGLPNIQGFAAGLPWNASNHFARDDNGVNGPSGCFYGRGRARSGKKDGREGTSTYMDASRSSAVYGRSSTVQPAAVTMRFCIRY